MKISFERAVAELQSGGVVAIPTETVYGLAASLFSESAIAALYRLKNRPAKNPLIVHVDAIEKMEQLVSDFPPEAQKLAEKFWPGPLTLVLPARDEVPKLARANLPSVAIRLPSYPLTRELIKQVGPLVAPSANLSGSPSSTLADHVESDFGANFPVLDGGESPNGVESTILLYEQGELCLGRLGAIPLEILEACIGRRIAVSQNGRCPGSHFKHYSPAARLYLGEGDYPGDPKVVVGYSDQHYPGATKIFSLGKSSAPEELTHNLYHVLRQLDKEKIPAAWVDCRLPKQGLYITLLERLKRASL